MRKLLWIVPAVLWLAGLSTPQAAPPPTAAVISSGTSLHVRVDEALDTRRNRTGDRFEATLTRPVVVNGRTVLPSGTRFHGHVTTADASGRLKGRGVLGLTLDGFRLHGRQYRIATTHVSRVSSAHKNRNAALIGGGAALGAAVGAIAGGGKGAGIGALAGGGAGTAGAAATGKKEVAVAAETPMVFLVRAPVRL